MNRLGVRIAFVAAALLAAAAALGWSRLAGSRLYLNGKVASTEVIMHNGVAYVPVKDVAAALSMTVQARGDGYALVHAGGGTQIEGVNGKIGDDLFNGTYRLKVLKVVRGDSYKRQFSHGDDIIPPGGSGDDVVAVVIRLKNGTQKTKGVMVLGNPADITDEDSHAYEQWYNDSPARNVDLLPGAAVDLALTYHVPKNAVLKDLVYTVDALPHTPAFRVSLKQP